MALSSKKIIFLTWCLGVLVVISLWPLASAFAAAPMMDADVYLVSRELAVGAVQNGSFNGAEQEEQRALQIRQELDGPLHPSQAPILNDLATIQRYEAKYAEAEQNYKWGLALLEKEYGPGHPSVAESLRYLASLDMDLGRYKEARLLDHRALEIQEKAFGKDSLEAASTWEDLGGLYNLMEDGQQARSALDRCLRIREKTWGKEDLRLVETLEKSARASVLEKDFNSAEDFLKRGLALRQKALAADRPEVADSMESLADFYRSQGRGKDAQALYEQVAQSRDRFLTNDDFMSLPHLHQAALTDLALGRLQQAGGLLTRVLKLRRTFYGPVHPKVAFCLEDMASLEEAEGRKSKAISYLKEADQILEKAFDPDHPEVQKLKKRLEDLIGS